MNITCEYCKTIYDTSEHRCPACGANNPEYEKRRADAKAHRHKLLISIPIIIVIICAICIIAFVALKKAGVHILPGNGYEERDGIDYDSLTEADKARVMNQELSERDLMAKDELSSFEIVAEPEAVSQFLAYFYPYYKKIEVLADKDDDKQIYIVIDDYIELEYRTYEYETNDTISYTMYERKPNYRHIYYMCSYDDGRIYR